jgi:membrane protein EpsK
MMEAEQLSIASDEVQVGSSQQLPRALVAPRGNTLWNAVVRFGAQFVAIGANLLATPYIIRKLGVESYGIIGVINTIVGFMAIVTTSLTSTVGRNMTFAIEREEYENANKEISTAVYGLVRLFAIALLPLCALSIFIDQLIVIPRDLASAARFFCFLAVVSFGFSTLSGPLGAAMYVRNRLDLLSGASLARTICFLAAIVALFSIVPASLTTYGAAMLGGSMLICFLHARIHKYLLPGIEISKHWYDRKILKGIVSLGGWMTVNQIGALLFLQTDLLVANRMLGVTMAGQLAAISVIPLQLRVLAGLFSGLFGPTQAAIAARGDWAAYAKYLLCSVRLTSLFFALLVGVFCGSAHEVLSIWLGPQFGPLTPVALVLTAYLIISLGISPTWDATLILGKVKIPAVVTLVMGVANVLLAITLAARLGLMGIALSGCIMLTLRNALFTPWYVSRACNMSVWPFLGEHCIAVACGAVVFLVSFGVNSLVSPSSMKMLAMSLVLSTALGLLPLLPLGMRALRRMS